MMSAWVDRAREEKESIDDKIDKLKSFLGTDPNAVSLDMRHLLYHQYEAMLTYSKILGKRIELANATARMVA